MLDMGCFLKNMESCSCEVCEYGAKTQPKSPGLAYSTFDSLYLNLCFTLMNIALIGGAPPQGIPPILFCFKVAAWLSVAMFPPPCPFFLRSDFPLSHLPLG